MNRGSRGPSADAFYSNRYQENRGLRRNIRDEQRRREIQGFPESNYRDMRQIQSEVANPYRLEIYLNVTGDYERKMLKYYPWMSNINLKPQSQYPYIFYNSVLQLNKALLRRANIGEDPQEIFSNLTNYRMLLQYANTKLTSEMRKNPTTLVGTGENRMPYAWSIFPKNMKFLKNIYFKQGLFFYDQNNRKYVIRSSKISYMEPKDPTRLDTWEVHFDIAVIDAEKNPGLMDIMAGNCNDKAKEIDDMSYELFGDTLGLYKANLNRERKLACPYGSENCAVNDRRRSDSDRYDRGNYDGDRYDRYNRSRDGYDRYASYDRYNRDSYDRYNRYNRDRSGRDRSGRDYGEMSTRELASRWRDLNSDVNRRRTIGGKKSRKKPKPRKRRKMKKTRKK